MFVYFNVLGHRFRHFYIRPRLATRKDEKAVTGILYADLEMDQLVEQGQLIDANGHYARPDVSVCDWTRLGNRECELSQTMKVLLARKPTPNKALQPTANPLCELSAPEHGR